MKKLFVLGLVAFCCFVFIASLAGCGQGGGSASYLVSYFPNTDGYKWTYNYLIGGLTGVEIHTFNGTTSYSGLTLQNLKTEIFIASSGATVETLMLLTTENLKTYGTASSPTTQTETSYVFPLVVGNTWTHHTGATATVVSKETVIVPAGTFADCYRVKVIDGTTTSESWLANNVGIVKIQNQYAGTLATCELTAKNF